MILYVGDVRHLTTYRQPDRIRHWLRLEQYTLSLLAVITVTGRRKSSWSTVADIIVFFSPRSRLARPLFTEKSPANSNFVFHGHFHHGCRLSK